MARKRTPPHERLDGKYTVNQAGCWEWTGKTHTHGYGIIAACVVTTGIAPKELRAHRVSYEKYIGPIPDGMILDHLCCNRRCINPLHLEPVTNRENLRRGGGYHSAAKTHCKYGHEFTEQNTLITKAGFRNCRTCAAKYQRRLRASRQKA